MNATTPYLGERAKLAVEYLNSCYLNTTPIVAFGEGCWKVTRPKTQWDVAMGGSQPWIRSDQEVIDSAIYEAGSIEEFEAFIARRTAGLVA